MKKFVAWLIIASFCLMLVGCYTNIHQVGNGAQGTNKVSKKEWYVLFGLVPIIEADSNQMAAGATDYTIKTQHDVVDVIIMLLIGNAIISSRTVSVTK
ncbi:hypothetical protein EHM69_04925 [candidate division KSB1 bacterium]|nr:MAG: hypothetical protein EHM69_04925 [candidate division KSB1 bacterium]